MSKATGYIRDIAYPAHFHREIQPLWLGTMARFLGSAAPALSGSYSWCELGCGVGINLLIAAATDPQGQFVGVDFNEQHLAVARSAAEFIGLSNIRFIHADFGSFARDNNLYFDVIVSHGVWSWIDPAQQQAVLQLVQQFLKPRGLFYLHYMAHPGASQMLSLQKLLLELSRGQQGSSAQKLETGLALLAQMDEAGAFHDQPRLRTGLQTLRQQNLAYLAHDLLAEHWQPQHSADMHRRVSQAGPVYLGSADPFENIDNLSIPGNLQPLLAQQRSMAVRETFKDVARQQHQRRDLFQRSPARLSPAEQVQGMDSIGFCLLPGAAAAVPLSFETPIGAIEGPSAIFTPLLAALNSGPVSFAELRTLPAFAGQLGLLSQSLLMLLWAGHVHPVAATSPAATPQLQRLVQWIGQQKLALQLVPECATAVHVEL